MDNPFQRWIDLARPRSQLLRTLVGMAIAAGVWTAWSAIVILIAIGGGLTTGEKFSAVFGDLSFPINYLDTVVTLGVGLATFWGLWFGVWLALRLLHRRSISTVLAPDGRLHIRHMLTGCGLAIAYMAVGAISNVFTGITLAPSGLPIEQWLVALGPLALLIFFQSAGEELLFRGYLVQQIAARVPHPLAWGLLPALGFGGVHAWNGGGDMYFAAYYVIAATMLGLVMTALVWRTGNLSAAIGFHFANNVGALLLIGVGGAAPPVTLYVAPYEAVMDAAPMDMLVLGLLLAFVLSPWAPLPKGQALRRNHIRAAP